MGDFPGVGSLGGLRELNAKDEQQDAAEERFRKIRERLQSRRSYLEKLTRVFELLEELGPELDVVLSSAEACAAFEQWALGWMRERYFAIEDVLTSARHWRATRSRSGQLTPFEERVRVRELAVQQRLDIAAKNLEPILDRCAAYQNPSINFQGLERLRKKLLEMLRALSRP